MTTVTHAHGSLYTEYILTGTLLCWSSCDINLRMRHDTESILNAASHVRSYGNTAVLELV
jgi:hypothetical protein